jgi:hypothetical protein
MKSKRIFNYNKKVLDSMMDNNELYKDKGTEYFQESSPIALNQILKGIIKIETDPEEYLKIVSYLTQVNSKDLSKNLARVKIIRKDLTLKIGYDKNKTILENLESARDTWNKTKEEIFKYIAIHN